VCSQVGYDDEPVVRQIEVERRKISGLRQRHDDAAAAGDEEDRRDDLCQSHAPVANGV